MAKAESLDGAKVLVTGAGGFIGSHLTERLVSLGASTRALVRYTSTGSVGWLERSPYRSEVEFVFGDVGDPSVVSGACDGAEVVFHLAALIGIPYSYDAPDSYVRTNVQGSLQVLQSAMRAGARRVIQTSTSEVYGSARYTPIDESHPLQAQSPYAASKIGADKLAESFHASFDLPVVIVRPFNTFGPRQSRRAVIPSIIGQCLVRDTVSIGSTAPTRDFTFVEDTVDGFIAAATAGDEVEGRTINLGTGQDISIGDLAQLIISLVGRDVKLVADTARVRPDRSEVSVLRSDNRLAKELLGWSPSSTLRDGLLATIAWARESPVSYDSEAYMT